HDALDDPTRRCRAHGRDRLAGPDRDRDVARFRCDLRTPKAVEVSDAQLSDLAGEERGRHDETAIRREVERAVRDVGRLASARRRMAPRERLERGAVATRYERGAARERD